MDTTEHTFAELLEQRLADYQPRLQPGDGCLQAAVSLVFRSIGDTTDLLFIQRAFHDKDPWSGQIAFPGGRLEQTDANAQAAAARETMEEVGLVLPDTAYVGQLDDVLGPIVKAQKSVHVSSFVYHLTEPVETSANYEVQQVLWIPLQQLRDDSNVEQFEHSNIVGQIMRGIRLNPAQPEILWGLSLWILFSLFKTVGIDQHRDYRIVGD